MTVIIKEWKKFNIMEEKGFYFITTETNRAIAISILNDLDKYKIPYKEKNDGIFILMEKEEFYNKLKKLQENDI